jgi:hypothetical protein
LAATRDEHADLTSVPLLATLLALVVAESTDMSAPKGRATLLLTAVRNSVHQWARKSHADDVGQPTDRQLLDGYAALGHRVSGSSGVTVPEATVAVTVTVRTQWELAPAAAKEVAGNILDFWDNKVGVFVGLDSGAIAPRSRVFAEIGAAMAVEWFTEDRPPPRPDTS